MKILKEKSALREGLIIRFPNENNHFSCKIDFFFASEKRDLFTPYSLLNLLLNVLVLCYPNLIYYNFF